MTIFTGPDESGPVFLIPGILNLPGRPQGSWDCYMLAGRDSFPSAAIDVVFLKNSVKIGLLSPESRSGKLFF